MRLPKLNYPLIEVQSLDKNQTGVCKPKLAIVANHSQSQTGGLTNFFRFEKSGRIMLTTSHDRLVNGQVGTIVDTKQSSSGILNKIYIRFEDENAGLTKMKSNRYASKNNTVPIVRNETNCSASLNSGPTIHQTQLPLMPAFPCAVHKVQGLTLPSIVVSSNLNRQKKL